MKLIVDLRITKSKISNKKTQNYIIYIYSSFITGTREQVHERRC